MVVAAARERLEVVELERLVVRGLEPSGAALLAEAPALALGHERADRLRYLGRLAPLRVAPPPQEPARALSVGHAEHPAALRRAGGAGGAERRARAPPAAARPPART